MDAFGAGVPGAWCFGVGRVPQGAGPVFRAGAVGRPLFRYHWKGPAGYMLIIVRDNNVDQALRALKKKLQREGVYREMKLRRHYEKPSEKRARERAAAVRRARKLDRKRLERDGMIR
jgi:small subunit ribosomal protein S21